MRSRPETTSSCRPNAAALGISLMAAGVLYAGTNTQTARNSTSQALDPVVCEVNPVASNETDSETTTKAPSKEDTGNRPVAHGRVALLTNMLMLEKARARVASFSGYSVNFHKHERIDGEMQDAQVVSMDVRHKPFSVYMKWKQGGDRGRQLLFVPERADGKALVKLGGFKGRLLPPMKIEPDGSRAMAESRYPITKAGILPLIDALVDYRKQDIEERNGVECLMYDNEEINGRKVFTFKVTYPSPEVSSKYRLAYSYLDQETMIPIRLKNYSWARDTEGLSIAELNEQTLVEDYGFSELEVTESVKLAELFKNKKL